jgi:hypothetical protein
LVPESNRFVPRIQGLSPKSKGWAGWKPKMKPKLKALVPGISQLVPEPNGFRRRIPGLVRKDRGRGLGHG